MNASIDDLKERKVGEFQLFVAQIMRSKIVDYFILVLIVLYTLLVVVYLAIDTIISQYPNVELGLEIVELVFLTIFVIEITMNFIAFGWLFVKDYWNIVDASVIFIAIGLVILDINYSGQNLDALLRLRGLFRLVRIGILLRKFDSIRKKSMARKQLFNRDFYHVMAPSEIVNNILWNIRDMIQNDAKLLEDINYWIKMVSSGKLYETNFGEGEGDDTDDKRKDAMSWVKSIQGKSKEEKRGSAISSGANNKRVSTIEVNDKLELTPAASLMLESVNKLDFNIFEFKDEVNERELYVLSTFLLQKHGLFESCRIDPDVYTKFIQRIQDYYNPSWIEYHNKTHGSDVCQTSYFFLNGWDFISIGKVTDLELAGILIAASCHDFEHPGFNNFFLVESRAPWAIEYNDKSPLENHHISATFSLIERPEFNIFKELEVKEFKEIRKNMIEIVLATDSANHFTEVAKLKQRISAEDFCPFGDDKLTVIKMMVHLADISNPVKNFELAFIWTGLLYDEFFKQGDRESELGRDISFLMDRKTINIAGSSIGFSKMLVQPAYEALASIIPMAQICVDNLGANIAKWEELKNDFEQKKINGDNYIEESRGKIKQKTSFPSPNRPSIIASFKADRESLESNRMHNSLLNP